MKRKLKSRREEVRTPTKASKKKTAQEIQDEIFRKMPFAKKIKLTSDLTMLYFELKRLNKKVSPPKTTFENIILSKLVGYKKNKSAAYPKEIKYFLKASEGYLKISRLKKQAVKLGITGLLKKFWK